MKALILTFVTLGALSAFGETVDLKKSSFTWTVDKVVGDGHSGTIAMKSAKINDGKGEFVADMNNIDVVGLKGEWKKKFLGHIKSKDFFTVDKHPTSKLVVEKVDSGYLYGKLTILGNTNHVTMPYKKNGKVYTGELGFDRTKFKMIYGSGNFFKNLGDKTIRDTVRLVVKIVTK